MDPEEAQENERRMQFVFALRSHGIIDRDVLRAMESVPRDAFLEGIFRERAHEDTPLPIACGQTISQPTVVGLMTQALGLTRRCKVLEIGTGSGYQAAILAKLARRVYTIERHKALAHGARRVIEQLGSAQRHRRPRRRRARPARAGALRPHPRHLRRRGPAAAPARAAPGRRRDGAAGRAVGGGADAPQDNPHRRPGSITPISARCASCPLSKASPADVLR
jgi:hypothetical protein